MKVTATALKLSAIGRYVVAVALSAVILLAVNVAPAHAVTRPEVLKRAKCWIKKRVQYSQSAYYEGYRRDCSGFVSMAWKLKTSYTSSDIGSVASKISVASLAPGDAVHRSGHVEIFERWKDERKRQYWALEESTSGKPALRTVKQFKRGYTALRLRGIDEVAPRAEPLPPMPALAPVPPAPLPSDPTTPTDSAPGANATPSANAGAAPGDMP